MSGRYAPVDEPMDIHRLISGLAACRRWFAFSEIFFFALRLFATYALTPIYGASNVSFLAEPNKDSSLGGGALVGDLGGVARLVGIDFGGSDSVAEQPIGMMKSLQLIGKFIAEMSVAANRVGESSSLLSPEVE